MKKIALPLALVVALGACGQSDEPEVVGGPADPMAGELAAANEIDMTQAPQILSSHSYRCGDNSVVEVSFIQRGDTLSATATPQGGNIAVLEQGEDGSFTAEGITVTGDAQSSTITFNGQTCRR